jgi:hypothetical protein
MNRIDFINLLNDPERVNLQNIGKLKEMIDFFPYFQTAHLLLLKGLHNSSDIKFAEQLMSSAVHIADREVLYYLLNTISDTIPVEKESTFSTSKDVIGPQIVAEESNTVKRREDLTEKIEARLQEIKVIATDKINVDNSEAPEYDRDSLTDEESFFELEIEAFPVTDDLHQLDQIRTTSSKADLLNFEYNSEEYVNGIYESSGQQNKQQLQKPFSSLDQGKNIQAELIDKFILSNPRIEPSKEKSGISINDISNAWHDEKGSFVTETLAKIYINQEYYSRAIDIYEKLSLKFPEKSSYFATQIEKIKELIKLK